MQVCNDSHEAIVYEGRNCPLCAIMEEKQEHEKKLEKVEDDLRDLEYMGIFK